MKVKHVVAQAPSRRLRCLWRAPPDGGSGNAAKKAKRQEPRRRRALHGSKENQDANLKTKQVKAGTPRVQGFHNTDSVKINRKCQKVWHFYLDNDQPKIEGSSVQSPLPLSAVKTLHHPCLQCHSTGVWMCMKSQWWSEARTLPQGSRG